ncbi:MAG: glutamate-ammonia-ligase adenylyltransferase [Porticoccus sp.]|jgi:glutamate-ammonia-ligase adenylyltransferase
MSEKILPTLLDKQWQLRLQHFKHVATTEQSQWLASLLAGKSKLSWQLKQVWSCSEFVAISCSKKPDTFKQLIDSGDLHAAYEQGDMECRLSQLLSSTETEEDLFKILRQFRNREIIRIIWRDFSKEADLKETTADMTSLAEACLKIALKFSHNIACHAWGTPANSSGEPQEMVVLGMGKLGGWELNISSDIDLIFAYPEDGETQGSQYSISNQEFFVRLSQKLIQALDAKNDGGFVFRVDMRLRPYGQSGCLISSFDAMEEYYQTQGRDWERYAMVKARVVAGDQKAGARLMAILQPFIYRKYTDFSTLESLRSMKVLINREVKSKGMASNIKLGAGGIREIEFIVQAFQIIHGGRDVRFQSQSLKNTVAVIESEKLLPTLDINTLNEGYVFLRNVEHILQGMGDLQTHMVPDKALDQLKTAYLMGFDGWGEFLCALEKHRSAIGLLFKSVIVNEPTPNKNDDENQNIAQAQNIWQSDSDESMAEKLHSIGYVNPQEALNLIRGLQHSRAVLFMAAKARIRLDALMPDLIAVCAGTESNTATLARIFQLIESIARRSPYLSLLKENPKALKVALHLCSASPWITEELSRNPAMLDELLDHRLLYSLPSKDQLTDELRQQLLRTPSDDLGALMEVLRYFKLSHTLRVATCEIIGALSLVKVSDYLSLLAEVILTHTVEIAWSQMVDLYGSPLGHTNKKPEFLVIGYGKLGSIELGYNSDLDLVFIYDASENKSTDGHQSIDNSTFFLRLGQKIIHILTIRTTSGVLYDVDVRLRPSGNSGMLVSSLVAFEKYQLNDAWTWEHQALVRARPVNGSNELIEKFNDLRSQILCQKREVGKLANDICRMREKMRNNIIEKSNIKRKLRKTTKQESVAAADRTFNIKHDAGGIIDIEFIVQFQVLSYAHQFTNLAGWSDNIRILEYLSSNGLMLPEDAENLIQAYISYRSEGHRLQLQKLPLTAKASRYSVERAQVISCWNKLLQEQGGGG